VPKPDKLNCSSGKTEPTSLRIYLTQGNLRDLPATSSGPKGDDAGRQLATVIEACYDGIQYTVPQYASAKKVGLGVATACRIGNSGCMQVDIVQGDHTAVPHFAEAQQAGQL